MSVSQQGVGLDLQLIWFIVEISYSTRCLVILVALSINLVLWSTISLRVWLDQFCTAL